MIRNQPDKIARPMALRQLVDYLCEASASRLIIERDESLDRADRRIIHESLAKNRNVDTIDYLHSPPTEHPLLWLSDAAAWCYQAGGDWVRRAQPLIGGFRERR